MTSAALGPEWVRGPDGRYFREAARVLLLDAQDRVLLVRGHDVDRPERSWWFTIGGGIDAGETPEAAAVREVREETGLVVAESSLVGPVLTRSAIFDFEAEHVRQDEVFFVARVEGEATIRTDGWTAVEQRFMDEIRWWSVDELAGIEIEMFPAELAEIVAEVVGGWDGTVRHLGLVADGRDDSQ